MVDCLFVGHNDPDFADYVAALRQLGDTSPTYRDLRLSYLELHGRPTTFPELYHRVRQTPAPFGICSVLSPAVVFLAGYIARRGFTFDWVNGFRDQREALERKLSRRDVRAIAITTTYYMSPRPVIEIVEFVRRHDPDCKIIVGGPYVYSLFLSKAHARIFKAIGADYYVVSPHGEAALVRLLEAIRKGRGGQGIPNVAYRSGASFTLDGVEDEVTDLERDAVEWRRFTGQIGRVASVRSALSCPFSCAFCGFPERGGTYRVSAASAVERELDELREVGGVEGLQFVDDTFNVPQRRYKDILRMMIRKKYGFKWNCQYRCQYADRESVELMKESGCEGVFLGLEAANDELLRNMNKRVTVEEYYRGLELLNEYQIPSHANFIIGFPGETEQSYRDVKTLLASAKPTFYRAQLWYCDPATPIWNERERYRVRGRGFEWTHATMDSEEAQAKVQELFLTWDQTTWTPQYNFEFYGVCQLLHEGLELPDIQRAIGCFNREVRRQLLGLDADQSIVQDVAEIVGCGRQRTEGER